MGAAFEKSDQQLVSRTEGAGFSLTGDDVIDRVRLPTRPREKGTQMKTLPDRRAMHRDIPPGSRLKIANAYALGQLIDVAELPRWLRVLVKRVLR